MISRRLFHAQTSLARGLSRRWFHTRTDNNSYNRELQAAVILDPFRDECFTATLGGGAKLNGSPMKVGEESTALEAVVVTGYAPTDASTDVMLKGMTGKHALARR